MLPALSTATAAAAVQMHVRVGLSSADSPMVASASDVRVSWELPPASVIQTSFQVRVAAAHGGTFDSGAIHSAEQNLTLHASALQHGAAVHTITVASTMNDSSVLTSVPQRFFTAPSSWAATPMWAAPCPGADDSTPPQFAWLRASLALPAGAAVESGLAFVTALGPVNAPPLGCCGEDEQGTKILGAYKLFVDGVAVGVGPGRSRCEPVSQGACAPEQPFDGFDLTERLQTKARGMVDIGIHAYGTVQDHYSIRPKVLFQLVVRLVGSTAPLVLSSGDGTWEGLDAASLVYRPSSNSGGHFGQGYWYYYPRENFDATCTVAAPPAACTACWQKAVAASDFAAPLVPKATQPVSIVDVPAVELTRMGAGHYVFELAREIQGGLRLALLDGAPAAADGATARVLLSEQRYPNGTARVPMRTGATYDFSWRLRKGAPPLEHHEYLNWRWGELRFSDADGAPIDLAPHLTVSAWQAEYPWDSHRQAQFKSSSSELDRVWELCRWTLEAETLDLYADSNARQRSVDCQADANVACQAQYSTSVEMALPRLMTEQIMNFAPQQPYPFPAPPNATGGSGGYVSPNWADWTVLPAINVVNDFLYTGDDTLASRWFDSLLEYHMYIDKINAIGLVEDPKLTALIDTSGGSDDGFHASPVNAVTNAWVYYGLSQVAQSATWLGRHADAARLTEIASKLKAAFNRLLVDPGSGGVCDGLCANVSHQAVHSTFYALAFGVIDEQRLPAAWAHLVQRLHASDVGVPCGAYPVQFLLLALYQNEADHGMEALRVLTSDQKHSWLAMMQKHEASTTMECWDPEELPNLSFSHVWASSPSFIIPWFLVGVRPLSPGYATLSVKPQPGDLTSVNVSVPTVRGPVAVTIDQAFEAGSGARRAFHLRCTLPGNVRAQLHAPTPRSGDDALLVDGVVVRATRSAQGAHVFVEVGGGAHDVAWIV